jgi:hypothetical protein
MSEPPGLGVFEDFPSGWVPVEVVDDDELELHASSRPPDVPTMATPAPAAAPRARNERRSIRLDMVPLRTTPGAKRLGIPPKPTAQSTPAHAVKFG